MARFRSADGFCVSRGQSRHMLRAMRAAVASLARCSVADVRADPVRHYIAAARRLARPRLVDGLTVRILRDTMHFARDRVAVGHWSLEAACLMVINDAIQADADRMRPGPVFD